MTLFIVTVVKPHTPVTVMNLEQTETRALCNRRSRPVGQYLLLLLVSADPESTAHNIQEALPGYGLETARAGTRDALRTAFVSVISRLHRARGVKTRPRGAEPLSDHPARRGDDPCEKTQQ